MSVTYTVCKNCGGVNKVQREKALAGQAVCGKCQASLPMQGLVSEVNEEGFRKILRNSELPVVVDFWASWCGPCQVYGPEFQRASQEYPDAVFLKVSTETETNLAAQMGVRGIPLTIIFKNGQEVKRQAGAMNAEGVKGLLESI